MNENLNKLIVEATKLITLARYWLIVWALATLIQVLLTLSITGR